MRRYQEFFWEKGAVKKGMAGLVVWLVNLIGISGGGGIGKPCRTGK